MGIARRRRPPPVPIADGLFLAIRSVEKVISSIFLKLGLTNDTSEHRRVMAVLRYLESEHQ